MGSTLSCVGRFQVPSAERVEYDLTPLQNKNLPIIWMAGQQNVGKKTHGNLIKEKYSFEILNTTDLLRREAEKETKRGFLVKAALAADKNVNDRIVIDILKEALLESNNDKGFVISNFPKNSKQAELFMKEIGNVSFVFYLFSDTTILIDRAQRRSSVELDEDTLRRNIASSSRDIKAGLGKFIMKIEGINTSGRPEEVFSKVETALIRRLNTNRPIVTETDYVRPQEENEESEQEVNEEMTEIGHESKMEQVPLAEPEQVPLPEPEQAPLSEPEQIPLPESESIIEKDEESSVTSDSDLF
nr:adenylate kinase isoenzyme 1-like isoform X1 [Leptinotarsa decemlineata]